MNKDNISTGVSILTSSFALANIQEILSIIILVISLLNILINATIKIYSRIKNKQYDKILDDINEASEQLENLQKKEGKKDE